VHLTHSRKGDNMRTGRPKEKLTLEEKFWTFVNKKGINDCWNWKGNHFKQGYGRMYHHSTKEGKAHRLSYMINTGEIPEGALVCHTCNNKSCVNPKHLYVGTNDDNMRDLANSGILKGEKNPASKLTVFEVLRIRRIYAKRGKNTYELSKQYNVSQILISQIIRGVSWKHVGGPLKQSTPGKRLTNKEVIEMRELYQKGSNTHELAIKFDRYDSTIERVVFGKTHKNLSGPIALIKRKEKQ